LLRTPTRVAASLRFLTQGYGVDVRDVIRDAVYAEPYEEMVLVRDVEVYSLCEHHMLPFYGRAHIAYMPRGRIVGLSKLPAWSTSSRAGSRCRSASPPRSPKRSMRRSTPMASRW